MLIAEANDATLNTIRALSRVLISIFPPSLVMNFTAPHERHAHARATLSFARPIPAADTQRLPQMHDHLSSEVTDRPSDPSGYPLRCDSGNRES